MHLQNTMQRSLCIIILLISLVASADVCYNVLNNDSEFYVQTSTPITTAYACQLSNTNVAYNAGTHTHTLSVAAGAGGITCSEMISVPLVSFGYYECEMQPPGIAGTVTSCMVVSTVRTKYEAVYVKFFGNETGRVYIGYYTGGRSFQAGPATLDFDATAKAHKYGFEWSSGYIKWYVDGREVSSALGNQPLPLTPNRFVANLVTESKGVETDDTNIPTDSRVDRVFPELVTSAAAVFNNISYTPVIYISCDNNTGIIPGGGGYDMNACDFRDPYVIFDDSLADKWSKGDSTTSDFASTSNVRTGSRSISWDVKPNGQLFFIKETTFPSTDYYSFEFWVMGGGFNGQQIGAKMLFTNGQGSEIVNLASVLTEGIQPWAWSRVVIPFTLFGISPNVSQDVRGFVLSSLSTEFGGRIGIDNVQLGHQYTMCINKTKPIYDDKLDRAYSDWSWGTWKLQSAETAHASTYSVQWELYSSAGIKFHSDDGVDTGEYQGISFWINVGQLSGWKWVVGMIADGSTLADGVAGSGPINLFKYYGGIMPQQDGQWIHVVIPFTQFGITSGSKVNGIIFKLETDQYQGTLYIDDISYVRQEQFGSASRTVGVSFGLMVAMSILYMIL